MLLMSCTTLKHQKQKNYVIILKQRMDIYVLTKIKLCDD